MRKLSLLAVIAAAIPAQLLAAGTAVIESRYQIVQGTPAQTSRTAVQWQDGTTLRLDPGSKGAYMVFRDGAAYSVLTEGGQTRVLEMSGMVQNLRAADGTAEAESDNPRGTLDAVEATGRTETVAGIEGEIYRVTATRRDGETITQDWVLTDDPLVTEMTRAYLGSLEAMVGKDAANGALGRIREALPDGKQGLLRAGDQFRVVSISDEAPPADAFELPAEPMSLQQMMQGMGRQ